MDAKKSTLDPANTAYTGPHQIRMSNWISCAPFEGLLNMEILEARKGHAVLRMPFLKQYAQGAGLMHGGALVSLADTAVVMAIKSLLPEGSHFATISLETQFIKPVQKGIVTARARVVASVDRNLEGRATIFNDDREVVARVECLFKVAKETPLEGLEL